MSSSHASFFYGTQDGKICFVFFLVILKDATSVWRGKCFDVGGYFRFAIVQVKYELYEFLPFSKEESFTDVQKWIHIRIYPNWICYMTKKLTIGFSEILFIHYQIQYQIDSNVLDVIRLRHNFLSYKWSIYYYKFIIKYIYLYDIELSCTND